MFSKNQQKSKKATLLIINFTKSINV